MTEGFWLLEDTSLKKIRLEWDASGPGLSVSKELREEIERRVAGASDVIKFSRAFLAWMNINYGFVDIIIGIGKLRGRDGSFHLIIPSMPCEHPWVEFRIDDACINGETVQETLAEVVEHEDEDVNKCRNHYYEGDPDILKDNNEED